MGDAAAAAEDETSGGGIRLAEDEAGVEEVGVPFVALGGVTTLPEGGASVVGGMCICRSGFAAAGTRSSCLACLPASQLEELNRKTPEGIPQCLACL